jgi:hypothetical protein
MASELQKNIWYTFTNNFWEKLSSNVEGVEPFKNALQQKIEKMGLSKDQIYNADETGLLEMPSRENVCLFFGENSSRTKSGKSKNNFPRMYKCLWEAEFLQDELVPKSHS